MSQKVTLKQQKAIELLASGNSVTEVATKLKMRRETLSRWKYQEGFFIEFEMLKNEMRRHMQCKLMQLSDQAMNIINQEMTQPDSNQKRAKIALDVLKMIDVSRVFTSNDKVSAKNDADSPLPKRLTFEELEQIKQNWTGEKSYTQFLKDITSGRRNIDELYRLRDRLPKIELPTKS